MRTCVELLALLGIAIAIALLLSTVRREDMFRESRQAGMHSSYRTLPAGYRALYLTLQRLHYPVQRQIRPYALLPERGLLIVADPFREDLSEEGGAGPPDARSAPT